MWVCVSWIALHSKNRHSLMPHACVPLGLRTALINNSNFDRSVSIVSMPREHEPIDVKPSRSVSHTLVHSTKAPVSEMFCFLSRHPIMDPCVPLPVVTCIWALCMTHGETFKIMCEKMRPRKSGEFRENTFSIGARRGGTNGKMCSNHIFRSSIGYALCIT